jgi:hypothetical protein
MSHVTKRSRMTTEAAQNAIIDEDKMQSITSKAIKVI